MAREGGIPFGAYRLERRLARGGMAEVFLARQRGPEGWGRRVALKRILPHLLEAEDFVTMFLDEARLAARLNHPNVVHIYEFGKVEEYFFIAMEFVDGVDAAALIADSGRMPLAPELVARIGADAAAGLHHAHQLTDANGALLGIVHRDISPQNLLVSYDGVVKIVDFGIAKATSQVERTRPGVVKGKFAYMSPEQVVGKSLDARSDVFSLGLVLWELLAGQVIVPREDPAESMRRIRDGKLPRIESVRANVPPAMAAAIGRALERDREKRPTAAQLGMELESYLKSAERLATSLVISEYLRARFPRVDASGPLAIIPEGGAGGDGGGDGGGGAVGQEQGTVEGTSATRAGAGLGTVGAGTGTGTGTVGSGTGMGTVAGTVKTDARTDQQVVGLPVRMVAAPVAAGVSQGWWIAAVTAVLIVGGGIALIIATSGKRSEVKRPVAAAPVEPTPGPVVQPFIVTQEVKNDPPVPVVAAPTTGTVEVVTTPAGASIEFDEAEMELGLTPVHLEISPGEHTLKLTLRGYEPLTRKVNVAAGERLTLEVALVATPGTKPPPKPPASARGNGHAEARPSTGYLNVKTVPWSDVYLRGKKLGTTPLADLELPAGQHTLVFRNPELKKDVRRAVTIRPGATTKLSVRLAD